MARSLDDPHAAVSNVAQGAADGGRQVEAGSVGVERGVLDPAGEREAAAEERVVEESAAAPEAKTKPLPDVGAASFRNPDVVLETVHGPDDRIRIRDTASYPYRASASLLITAGDGSQWIGTAWFISPRTLATAGHCVYIKNSPVPGRDGWVKSIQVMPGRDGKALPFGSITSSVFWTVRGWAEAGAEDYDYGAIVLPTPLGRTTGTLGFADLPDGGLRGAVANIAGYPGDKDPGELWYDTRTIAALSASKVHYDIDTAGGQSGAAVYVVRENQRLAVAIHAYGGPTTNSGTRISAPVFENLKRWKA